MLKLLFNSLKVLSVVCYTLTSLLAQLDITPREKVYIHTDREKYGAGETIYFSAYHYDQGYEEDTGTSRVLYVELINQDGEQIGFQWLKLYSGRAEGSIDIDYQLKSQYITLRAYTGYMRNFDDSLFFRKQIEVVGISEGHIARDQDDKVVLQAFPEGGDLLNDIVSIAGVKLLNGNKGISGTLTLYEDDEPINDIETNEVGLGKFVLKPQQGSTYTIKYGEESYTLPKALDIGLHLRTRTTTEAITIYIDQRGVTNSPEHSIMLISDGQVLYNEKIADPILKLPKKELPTGLLTVVIIDPNGRPIHERLLFNHYGIDRLSVDVATEESYTTRQSITIPIDVLAGDRSDVPASLSISVVDNRYFSSSSDIVSSFLLESEIKGMIENPSQYLKTNDIEVINKTDLLLLTQGWRRYNWEQPERIDYPKEQGIALSGRTVKAKKVNQGLKTYGTLSIIDEDFDIIPMETDDQGYFNLGEIGRYDEVPLFFQLGTKKQKEKNQLGGTARGNTDIQILLDRPTSHPITDNDIITGYDLATASGEQLDYQVDALADDEFYIDEGLLLDEVTIEAKKVDEWVDYYDDVINYAPSGNRVFTDNIPSLGVYTDIYDILRGRVTGIEITRSASGNSRRDVIIRGSSSGLSAGTRGNNAAGFLLNGSLVSASTAESINPVDIAFIDVIKGLNQLTQFGSEGSGGIIAIYLKPPGARSNSRTSTRSSKKDNGLNIDYQAYSSAKEFYKPNYGADGSYEKSTIRRTVHWQPLLKLYEGGSAEISFYTSDYIGTYHIDIQGISADGTPISHQTTFNVGGY